MDKISQEFAEKIRRKLKNHLKQIILFGSHDRGDFNDGSDYDILIIIDKKKKNKQETILRAGTSISSNYEESTGAFSKEDFIYKIKILDNFIVLFLLYR